MPDYSEFPTTPTAWQEQALRELTAPDPAPVPAPPPPARVRRGPDLATLVTGLLFVVLAVLGLSGADLPLEWFEDGGVLWVVLIGLGVSLLLSELRRARRRR